MPNYELNMTGGGVDNTLANVEVLENRLEALEYEETYESNGVYAVRQGKIVHLMFDDSIQFSEAWGSNNITQLPSSMFPYRQISTPLMLQGDHNATPAVLYVRTNGKVDAAHKGGYYDATDWGFASVSYPIV